jgi:branched-chain amino acid transport system substrate-binding protein
MRGEELMRVSRMNWLIVAVVLMLAAAGCGTVEPTPTAVPPTEAAVPTEAPSEEAVVVGIAAGFTGVLEGFDVPAAAGAEIAVQELNEAGGILGRPVEVVTADTKSDVNQGARAGLEVIEQGADLMLVTPDFNWGGGAAREADKAGIAVFSMGAGSPKFGIEGIGRMAFTVGTPGSTDGAVSAEWGYDKGFRTAYLLLDDVTDYDKDQCRGFQQRWEELGGEILGSDTFKNSDPSIAPQVSRITALDAEPDLISLCSFPPGGAVAVKQLRDAGVNSAIVSNGAFDGDFWYKDSIPDLSDFYFITSASIWGDDPSPEVNEFVDTYVARTGERPQNNFSFYGYAAMHILARAAEAAGTTDGEAVVAVIEGFDQEPVAGMLVTFSEDAHIDTAREVRVIGVENGEHFVDEVRSVEKAPPLFAE